MKTQKIVNVFIFAGIIGFSLFLLYLALPLLITLAGNILYLGLSLIFFIVLIVAIVKIGKRLFK